MREQNPERYEKTLTLKMSEKEHARIKLLAQERRQTVKGLIFSALDNLAPGWMSPKKERQK